jgi:nitroreductase
MTVLDIIKKRYAAKNFSGENIAESKIAEMKEAIKLAPSSFNWQPWKVKIVEDNQTLKKLQEVSWGQPQIGNASHLFIFCAVDSFEENNEKLIANVGRSF